MTNIQKKIFYARKFILLFISLFFGFVSSVYALNATLQWNPSSEPDLAGYRLFSREKGHAYDYTNPSAEVAKAWCNLNHLDENKTYYFVVRAFDTKGLESGDSNEVCLKAAKTQSNQPPTAVIAEDSIEAASGTTVTLDGSRSTDTDDGIFSYHWSQVDGLPVTLSDPNSEVVTFIAPETDPYGSNPIFRLTVTDLGGLQSTADCLVYLIPENKSETVVLEAHFDNNREGFSYLDDAFRNTSQPGYADGGRTASGGFIGGALQITMGGIDSAYILDMSGGWRQDFVLSIPTEIVLSFRYKLIQAPDYEYDEMSQLLVSVDHILYGKAANDYVVQIRGDGNGGISESTDWQFYEVNLGVLEAGNHTLTIGSYNNKKTYRNESTRVLIDDVLVKSLGKSNRAPYVDAGFDQTITLSDDSVPLDGTMTDDGLPGPPVTLSTVWYKVSGPGTVDFFDARAVDTNAGFSEAGTYVLRLLAYDGEFISSDDVTITVKQSEATSLLESGTYEVDGDYVTVNLANIYVSPVVVCSVHYNNNTTPVVVRVNNLTSMSFDVRLQNPSGGAVERDTVSYLVVEEGAWNIDGVKIEAQTYMSMVSDENDSWVGETQAFGQSYTSPVVLGQVMSENDPAFSVFWCQGSSRDDPPSANALITGKTVGEDIDTTRAEETVGFIVFEAGHGRIGGVEFEAALGEDSVRGVTESPPYSYIFDTAFGSIPQVMLGSMAGMKGINGGWAYMHGPMPASATSLYLAIDEDQIVDSERTHIGEQIGYVVFETPLVYR